MLFLRSYNEIYSTELKFNEISEMIEDYFYSTDDDIKFEINDKLIKVYRADNSRNGAKPIIILTMENEGKLHIYSRPHKFSEIFYNGFFLIIIGMITYKFIINDIPEFFNLLVGIFFLIVGYFLMCVVNLGMFGDDIPMITKKLEVCLNIKK